MQKLKKLSLDLMKNQHFDSLAVGVVDFSCNSYDKFEIKKNQVLENDFQYFDLASLTKPLTLATTYLKHSDDFTDEMCLYLNHCAGIPAGGRISPSRWREYILSFRSNSSADTIYSDYSALRAMLEIEKKINRPLYEICSSDFDKELFSWIDHPHPKKSVITGKRGGKDICGEVHDDNAFYLKEKVSHAGLFSSIDGICKTILNLEKSHSLLSFQKECFDRFKYLRFKGGWDSVSDLENTLAGKGCSKKTFGHLGFTGTSVWIDIEKKRGIVILTNATQNYWYEREGLRMLRRELAGHIWSL